MSIASKSFSYKQQQMTDVWRCPICCLEIKGRHSIANHRRNLYRKKNDPHRCDNYLTDGVARAPPPIRVHNAAPVVTGAGVQSAAADATVMNVVDPTGPTPVITEGSRSNGPDSTYRARSQACCKQYCSVSRENDDVQIRRIINSTTHQTQKHACDAVFVGKSHCPYQRMCIGTILVVLFTLTHTTRGSN